MKLSFDASDVLKNLGDLADPLYSVARTMGVAVGAAMRDEAKANVNSETGRLKDAIVVKYAAEDSSTKNVRYVVTWNRKKAPHGHLVEFGHWRTHEVVKLPDGTIRTGALLPRAEWDWTPAKAFLRRAQTTITPRALNISVAAGAARWAELQNGGTK